MKVLLGLMGTVLLIIAANVPILQDQALYELHGVIMPFWQYGDRLSQAALVLVVMLALFLTLLRQFRWLWLPAVGALLTFAYIIVTPFWIFKKTGYLEVPRLSTLSFAAPRIVWWLAPLLFLGPLLLFLAAFLRHPRRG